MTVVAETVVENQTLDITKVEEPFKSDKEVIAEEEAEEKKDEEKKDEEVTEKKNGVKEKKKPVVHKKDFSEDVVYLFQFNRSPQIPSISPLCLQVESWLKLHGIKFESIDLKSKLWSKEGKMLPFVELNGENIVNSNIFEKLSNKFEKEIDINLTEDQMKVEKEMTKLVENDLYWAIVHWRSVDYKNLLKGYKMIVPTTLGAQIPPGAIKVYFNYTFCRRGLKQVKTSEVGTNTKEEIEQFGKDALKKVSEKLGGQKFLFGDDVSSLDLLVFSYVAQIAMVNKEQPCALREFLETDCNNLLELIEMVKENVWGEDWEKATGEKMQMNPHLDVEEQKIVEQEEVKAEVIKRNRGGTLSRIRGAFDMKKFANAKKVEVEEKEKVEEGEKKEKTEKMEEKEEGEETKVKEDSADITEEKTEDKKKAGTLSRMRGIFDNKKVEKEDGSEEKTEDSPNNESTLKRMLSIFKKKKHLVEKKKTEEDKTGDEKTTEGELEDVKDTSEAQEIVTDIVNEIVEKRDGSEEKIEDSPNNENTLTRMLSTFMKKKHLVEKTEEEKSGDEETIEDKLEEVKDTKEEKKEIIKEESSSEAHEIVTGIVNEIADTKNLSKESENL